MSNVRIPLPFYGKVELVKKGDDGYSKMNDSGENQKKGLTESQPVNTERKSSASKIKSLFNSLPSIPVFGKKKEKEEDAVENPSFRNRC